MVAIFLNIFIFLFGLIVGSFLNCLIYRLEQDQGKTILKGKSFCPKCHHSLRWFDLFPVISFFFLKGKCRYCSKKISWQYPTVEIATGLLFLLIFNFQFSMINEFSIFNQFLVLFFWFIIWSLLLVIFVYDLKHYIIPDKVLVPFLGFILFFRILPFFGNWKLEIGNSRPLLNGLFLACFVSFIFFLIWLASKGRAMGFGDVKLIFPL
ncbi:prepilin peptidase, partial [Candidatus Gribaldobacteria bacterium]|nr:prepilin peptidase [Candidatus Gribaldobacteria bacterium]